MSKGVVKGLLTKRNEGGFKDIKGCEDDSGICSQYRFHLLPNAVKDNYTVLYYTVKSIHTVTEDVLYDNSSCSLLPT